MTSLSADLFTLGMTLQKGIRTRDCVGLIIHQETKKTKMLVFHPGLVRGVGRLGSSLGHFGMRGYEKGQDLKPRVLSAQTEQRLLLS